MKVINLDNHRTIVKDNFKLKKPEKITSYLVKSSSKSKLATLKIKSLRLFHFAFGGFKWVNSNKITKTYKPLADQLQSQLDTLTKKDTFTDEEKNTVFQTRDKILDVVKLFDSTTFKTKVESFMKVKQWEDLVVKLGGTLSTGIIPTAPPPMPKGWRPPRVLPPVPVIPDPATPLKPAADYSADHEKKLDAVLGEGTADAIKKGIAKYKNPEEDDPNPNPIDFGTNELTAAEIKIQQAKLNQAELFSNLGEMTNNSKVKDMISRAEQNPGDTGPDVNDVDRDDSEWD